MNGGTMAIMSDLATRRVPVLGSVQVDAAGAFPSRVLSMLDLSSGGFFVHTAFPLPVGTRLTCRFHLGDEPAPVSVQAEVAWIRPGPEDMNPPPGMGLRFVRLPHAVHERILRVIEAHNEHIQYFQQHQELPEDAMRWKIPRVQLEVGESRLDTRLESWNGRFQVVTMALPFQAGQSVRSRAGENPAETGRIAWIQFLPDGPRGAEMMLGIELQMHSWGEETVLRRPTGEVSLQEADEPEWEYEIVQSIPASMTLAPTLPLPEEARQQVAPAGVGPSSSKTQDAKAPVPAPTAPPDAAPAAKAALPPTLPTAPPTPAAAVEPQPAKPARAMEAAVPAAIRRPAPMLPSDTYPVASPPHPGGKWPLTRRATGFLAAGAFFFTAILLMVHPSSPLQPARHLAAPVRSDDFRRFLNRKPPEYLPTRGRSSLASAAVPAAPVTPSAPAAAPTPLAPPANTDTPPAAASDAPVKPKDTNVPALAEIRFSSRADVTTITIPVSGPVGKTRHYFLADPAGVVLDIEESRVPLAGGAHPGDARHIRKIKVVPMTRKSRVIVYTQPIPEKVDVAAQDGQLQLRLTFSERVARR